MPSDPQSGDTAIDRGLLSPVTVGHDALVSDAAVLGALVAAEVALVRAYGAIGMLDAAAVESVSLALGWSGPGEGCTQAVVDLDALIAASVAGGNPVIPLVKPLRVAAGEHGAWVHRGATSQDILDTALMLIAVRACDQIDAHLGQAETHLRRLITEYGAVLTPARTLTQHAVPTTMGARLAGWLRAISRARARLGSASAALPAQLGGAGGTLASFVEITGSVSGALALVQAYAVELRLAEPDAPWHTTRWPVTELGDALAQALDALGVLAADVATGSRTEIGEFSEGEAGGSSAMPQKQNPAASVLVRSAALRGPHLAATLHTAAGLAVDERPDGAWHTEWPALRELLRLGLGASATAVRLLAGLRVDAEAAGRATAMTGPLLVSERLAIALTPLLGADAVTDLVTKALGDADLAELLRALPETGNLDVDALLAPSGYLGAAAVLTERAVVASVADETAREPRGDGQRRDDASEAS